MPITTLAVTSLDANWTLGAGANRTVAVAQPDDDDTSYITDSANAATTFSVADFAYSPSSIASVRVHVYAKTTLGGPELNALISTDGWSTSAASQLDVSNASYQENDAQFDLTPAGAAWTVADVNNLQVRLQGVAELTTWRVSTITVTVQWSSAAFTSRSGRMLAGFEDII